MLHEAKNSLQKNDANVSKGVLQKKRDENNETKRISQKFTLRMKSKIMKTRETIMLVDALL